MIHKYVAKELYNVVFPSLRNDDRIDIFLVGRSSKDKSSLRYRLREKLERDAFWRNRHAIYYPEEIFSDLLFNNKVDLLSLENLLAKSVSVIVICLEGPGAIAELGAFVNHAELKDRVLVIADEKHKRAKSFIRKGPLRYLETSVGSSSIIWYPYHNGNIEDLKNHVKRGIKKISQRTSVERGLGNPIVAAKFLLILVNVLKPVSGSTIEDCISHLVCLGEGETKVVCTSALRTLFQQRAIFLRDGEYILTYYGRTLLEQMLPRNRAGVTSEMDRLRWEYLNVILRGKQPGNLKV